GTAHISIREIYGLRQSGRHVDATWGSRSWGCCHLAAVRPVHHGICDAGRLDHGVDEVLHESAAALVQQTCRALSQNQGIGSGPRSQLVMEILALTIVGDDLGSNRNDDV